MLIMKMWDHAIKIKKKFMPRKRKMYPLSREKREEIYKFIEKQLKKEYQTLEITSNSTFIFCRKEGW